MKRLPITSLILSAAALPVWAQHAGGHGGFSSHAGSSFHGGFSSSGSHFSSGPSHFAAPSRSSFAGPRTSGFSRPATMSSLRSGSGSGNGARAPYYPSSRYRRNYRSRYSTGVPYLFPGGVVSWINPDFLGYPGYYDDFSDAATTGDAEMQSPAYVYQDQTYSGQDEGREPYSPMGDPRAGQMPPAPEDAVTLIFKDGRPTEQIHNYALTRSTLYVLDAQRRDIPVDQLDLGATEQANRDAGVQFQLPVSLQ